MENAVILPEITPNSLEVGGMEEIGSTIDLFPNASLKKYLPENETQANTYFDTWGCVSHSFENALESLIIRQIDDLKNKDWILNNLYKNGKQNFSDRDLFVI